jgi:hypothetical protein
LTTRDRGRLNDAQARVACAATLLRWLYAIITTGQTFDPDIATGTAHRRSRQLSLAA